MKAVVRIGLLAVALVVLPAFSVPALGQCPAQTFSQFEADAYTVRDVRVTGPLLNRSALRDGVVVPLVKPGARVEAARLESARQALRTFLRDAPSSFESPLTLTVITADVANCDPAARTLDVVYQVLTTKVQLAWSRTPERARQEATDPAGQLALAPSPSRFSITPLVRYSALEHVVAGGRLSAALPRVFERLAAEVTASDVVTNVDVELTGGGGERDGSFFRGLEWSGRYHQEDRPTGDHHESVQHVAAQFAALSRPLGSLGAVARLTSALQGADTTSNFTFGSLPAGYSANARYTAWKSAAGVSFRSRRHAVSGSYGIQLGFTSGEGLVDFRKSIGEVVYDGRFAGGAAWLRRRAIEVGSRLSAGRLSGTEGIPAAERFLGGNVAVPFLGGDRWDLRENPVVRSFPAFSFASPGGDTLAGGDYFVAYNLTASMPAWVLPLVPAEITEDRVVRQTLEGQLNSAETALETTYKISDPAHQRAMATSQSLTPTLEAMQARLEELAPSIPAAAKTGAQSCQDQIETLIDSVEAIGPATYVGSLLAEPVDEADATLPSVIRVCVNAGVALDDMPLTMLGRTLVAARASLADQIAQIDVERARRLAAADMSFARDTVGIVMDEMNAISVGPVFIFDVATLGQRQEPASHRTSYAVGTGIRLSVASSLHLSAGYVWNANRAAGERPGAAFATLELTTLLGR
jgi:hypothetical protein